MQTKSSQITIKFIHGFILFIAFLFFLVAFNTIQEIIQSPSEIAVPIRFSLEEAGKINYESGGSYDFKIRSASGIAQYYPQNLDNAPMPYYNIFNRLIDALIPIFIFFLLHKIMQTARRKTPFILSNVRKLRWIGVTLIIWGFLTVYERFIGMDFLADHVASSMISFTSLGNSAAYNLGFTFGIILKSPLVLGLISLFAAEILKYGIDLQNETELTI